MPDTIGYRQSVCMSFSFSNLGLVTVCYCWQPDSMSLTLRPLAIQQLFTSDLYFALRSPYISIVYYSPGLLHFIISKIITFDLCYTWRSPYFCILLLANHHVSLVLHLEIIILLHCLVQLPNNHMLLSWLSQAD